MERYAYLWEYLVPPERQAQYLRHYGPDGTWATLFRRSPGYLETVLLRDETDPTRFVTIDRWRSRAAHDEFLRAHRDDYQRIDRECEALTTHERKLGDYTEPDPEEA